MDSGLGDEALLLAVADRDMGAFRALYERHAGWLAIRLARRCNDRDLVADAVGDTFVAVWQRPRGFRGGGDVAAWLWGVAIRPLVSRLRTRGGVAAVSGNAGAGQHLLSCGPCRARVTAAASVIERSVIDHAAVWDRTRDAVEVPASFAWLLPAAGFVAVVLAASTWVSPLNAAMAVSAAWLMTVWLLATRPASPAAVLQARAQAAFLALAAASFSVFLVRRRRLHQLRPWR
jgi:DNA-directed RNA polymerase specialized sigma24 family protein